MIVSGLLALFGLIIGLVLHDYAMGSWSLIVAIILHDLVDQGRPVIINLFNQTVETTSKPNRLDSGYL